MIFAQSWVLLFLIVPVLLVWWEWRRRGQPLVLPFDVAGELGALDLAASHVVLDLEQAVPVDCALLDGAGHTALLLTRSPLGRRSCPVPNRRP